MKKMLPLKNKFFPSLFHNISLCLPWSIFWVSKPFIKNAISWFILRWMLAPYMTLSHFNYWINWLIKEVTLTCIFLPPPPLDPFHLSSYSDITEGGDRLSWERGMEMGAPQAERSPLQLPSSSSPSLADLLVMLGAASEPRQSPADMDPIDVPQVAAMMGGGAGEQGRSPTLSWPRPDRRKRNFSLGVAGMCCNQGCTKNDIGRLCWDWVGGDTRRRWGLTPTGEAPSHSSTHRF